MKKLWLAILIVSLLVILYLFYLPNNNLISHTSNLFESSSIKDPGQGMLANAEVKKFATEKIKTLAIIDKQCEKKDLHFDAQVKNIHQGLIGVLEQELRQGKTKRELLAYSNQYKNFYRSYHDLLQQAKVNIEKAKYQHTSSVSILNNWNGLSVIDGFSSLNRPIIVKLLTTLENNGMGQNLSLGLDQEEDVSKLDVYELLDNNDKFTTYLESPLSIAGSSVISPSLLFVLNGTKLTIDEFRQATSLKSFTVNDVAVAIKIHMPIDYLKVLIENTEALGDMPIFIQGPFDSYENLADLAVSEYNTELLNVLEANGIKPTNEIGIITGMDIAVMNLPREPNDYQNVEQFPRKYLDTLTYLHNNGYRAHGSINHNTGDNGIDFQSPYSRDFQSQLALEPELQNFLHSIELIDNNSNIEQIEQNDSIVSNAINALYIQKKSLNNNSEVCKIIKDELLAAEGFSGRKKAYKIISELKGGDNDIELLLHTIDPVLVHLWRAMKKPKNSSDNLTNQEGKFIELLRGEQYQDALNYTASTPLTQQETDLLLTWLEHNTDELMPIWKARNLPKYPSSLMMFKYLPIEKWQHLLEQGFDFSITDVWGNDIFLPAMMNSTAVVSFLLDNGFSSDVEKLGIDILDLALEDSYARGKLNENTYKILNMVPQLEANHYSRIARLKKFFPTEYEKLIKINEALIPPQNIEINEYRFTFH
jgi:hypothetical protein